MIIGITGFKRSGKDTFAKLISEYVIQPKPEILYFADSLKKSAFALLCNDETLSFREWADIFKEKGAVFSWTDVDDNMPVEHFSGREILQRYGTEAHRDIFGEDFWINQILPLNFDDTNKLIIIPDLRFENEAKRVRVLGGKIVRINRDSFGEEDRHSSEQPISNSLVDFEIDNNESLDYLRGEVKSFCYHNIFPYINNG